MDMNNLFTIDCGEILLREFRIEDVDRIYEITSQPDKHAVDRASHGFISHEYSKNPGDHYPQDGKCSSCARRSIILWK